MNILIACDSFKGCCSSEAVADAISLGVRDVCPDATIRQVLIADGGEGTMRTLVRALGGTLVHVPAHDALMRPIDSVYGVLPDGSAVLDMAETGGLAQLSPSELRPLDATTYGLGQQMADALRHGCSRMLIGLGGSATTDAGMGMMQALRDAGLVEQASQCPIEVLCDVTNPLFGPQGAAYVFGPQKGATPDEVALLDQRLRDLAAASPHPEVATLPGSGAAGGLGFALMCYLGGQLVSGIDTVLRYQRFDELVRDADLVITGEGTIDRQTLMNKAPLGVLHHAEKAGVPVVALAGKVEDRAALLAAGFRAVLCINPPATPLAQALDSSFATSRLRLTTMEFLKTL